ncbi:MAG: AMP-binding protein, partial [Burkholderiales bacterium]|nr:AMP-binding protein [Burkholderiales bacterium]
METQNKGRGLSGDALKKILARQAANKPNAAATQAHDADAANASTNATQFPLAPSQARMYFAEQETPHHPSLHSIVTLELSGKLNPEHLHSAWQDMLQRHAILRTAYRFDHASGNLQQEILPSVACHFQVKQLDSATQHLNQYLQQYLAQLQFDLARGEVSRVLLLQQAGRSILCIALHHIAFDGGARQILLQDFGLCYQARVQGLTPAACTAAAYHPLAKLEADANATRSKDDPALSYWRQQLAGLEQHDLFALRRHGPEAARQGKALYFPITLDAELGQIIRTSANQLQCTPFVLLLAVYQILLARLSLEQDICVGTPVANRRSQAAQNSVGCFINTVALRGYIDWQQSLAHILPSLQTTLIDAMEYQHLPFEEVVRDAVQGQRSQHGAFFQAMFALQAALPAQAWFGPDIQIENHALPDHGLIADLMLNLEPNGDGYHGQFLVNAAIASTKQVAYMAQDYLHLLRTCLQQPHQRLASLPLLPSANLAKLHRQAQGPALAANALPVLPDMLQVWQRSVRLFPQHLALEGDAGWRLSYRELDLLSDQIAAQLLPQLNLTQAQRIVCIANKSAALASVLLATLKIGVGHLCLSPDLPAEPLQFQLHNAAPNLILYEAAAKHCLPASDIPCIALETLYDLRTNSAMARPSLPVPGDLAQREAYLIHTSGTTGKPKGISVSQGALANLVSAAAEPSFHAGGKVLQSAAMSFDASIVLLWGALANGCCALYSSLADTSLAEVARLVEAAPLDMLFLTPSMLQQVMQHYPQSLRQLRCLMTGGEAAQAHQVSKFLNNSLRLDVCYANEYGPAENSVISSQAVYRRNTVLHLDKEMTIGQPLAGRSCHLLDHSLQPVPNGAPGMLYVGGAGLATSYLNLPQLNTERFIPSPLPQDAGARLYQTGDMALRLDDGNLYFLGRSDTQVKFKGVRIELEEIEMAMHATGLVEQCVAALQTQENGDKLLVAYFVPESSEQHSSEFAHNLRLLLSARLPGYYLPALILPIAALPLTRSGKVDRRALPALPKHSNGRQYSPAQGELETALVTMLQAVLPTSEEPIGRD